MSCEELLGHVNPVLDFYHPIEYMQTYSFLSGCGSRREKEPLNVNTVRHLDSLPRYVLQLSAVLDKTPYTRDVRESPDQSCCAKLDWVTH